MPLNGNRRRSSLGFGLVLIAVGVFFLVLNLRPGLDPWPFLFHYWPVILIVLGLAKLAEILIAKRGSGSSRTERRLRGGGAGGGASSDFWNVQARASRFDPGTSSAERGQGCATSVVATLEVPAGELNLNGGSSHLLDADFRYARSEGQPHVDYNVSGQNGQLRITQHGGGVHMGARK